MDSTEGRIIVLRPDSAAEATVVRDDHAHAKDGVELITGHDSFLFVARGEGAYRIGNHTGVLRPNTLISAPAGSFACSLGEERELYVVSVRDTMSSPDDPRAFTPFFERRLSAVEGRHWHERMAGYAERASAGLFVPADVTQLKNAILPYVWRRETHAMLPSLFESIWSRLAQPLTLEGLAAGVGYTANYLNDLTRAHTGRPLGQWITDMRMARARAALEHTDLAVAEIGTQSGYGDPAYFSRAFRRSHGVPPATWRIASRPVDARFGQVALPLDDLHAIEAGVALEHRSYSFAS